MILIVDDDPAQACATGALLTGLGHPWHAVASGAPALKRLSSKTPNLSTALFHLPPCDTKAENQLAKMIAAAPGLSILVLSEPDAIASAVAAMRLGACDVLVKPVAAEDLEQALKRVSPSPQSLPTGRKKVAFDDLVAHSPLTRQAIALAKRAARATIPILIQGESGVGKEVFAQAIHDASPRASGPFIAVNCGAIPETLVESLLFGHEKGAFTGAVSRASGKFQDADGGVLFLDEIGELPMAAQVKLLRALQDGVIQPVGAPQPIKSDFRLISATNRDLARDAAAGRFREDLYYRLSAFPVTLPALRHRKEDILPLAELFTHRFATLEQRRIEGVGEIAATLLLRAGWPGNVRQLENAIHRAVILSESAVLDVVDFPDLAFQSPMPGEPVLDRGGSVFLDRNGHIRPLAEIESDAVRAALDRYSGAVSEAARRLGIGRSTLYRKAALRGEEPN